MGHKGISYEFSMRELGYLLFKKKKCPRCGGSLEKKKIYETKLGKELNSKADAIFIPNAKIKQYQYIFCCRECGSEFTLEELSR